jgi:rod shape-determining protein MreB
MNNWKKKLHQFWSASLNGLSTTESLAIDLGTSSTRIFLPGEGVVVDEPSVIAFDSKKRKFVAVGEKAIVLAYQHPRTVHTLYPIREGVITDYNHTGHMLSLLIHRVLNKRLISPTLLICVPAEMTQMEEYAYKEAASRAGVRKLKIIEAPYAAAAGAGLNLRATPATMIVDLGAGTTDIVVISCGNFLHASSRRIGGDAIDRAIAQYLHLERMLDVGQKTAENVKIGLGTVGVKHTQRSMIVRGRNLITGLPEEITVTSAEIQPLIQPLLRVIKQQILAVLEEIPTEASVDLLDTGISLSGGLSQLTGLAEHLGQELGLYVRVVPDPMQAAIIGAGSFLEEQSRFSALKSIWGSESASANESESSLAKI